MTHLDLEEKSTEQLLELMAEKQDEQRTLRFQAREGQLKTVRDIRKVRKMIAQIQTILKGRQKAAV